LDASTGYNRKWINDQYQKKRENSLTPWETNGEEGRQKLKKGRERGFIRKTKGTKRQANNKKKLKREKWVAQLKEDGAKVRAKKQRGEALKRERHIVHHLRARSRSVCKKKSKR